MNELDIKFAENPEPRCPVLLLLDTSSSMRGNPINNLNEAIKIFIAEILQDDQASLSVELSIYSFSSEVNRLEEFGSVDSLEFKELTAHGNTMMYSAIDKAMDYIEETKKVYKANDIAYYRPWMIIITDGQASDYSKEIAQRFKEEESSGKFVAYIIAVGSGINKNQLKELSNNPPIALDGLNFKELFVWLSSSVKEVSREVVGAAIEAVEIPFGKTL